MSSLENITSADIAEDAADICVINILSSKSQLGSDVAVINNDIVKTSFVQKIHDTLNVKLYIKNYNVSVSTSPTTYIIYAQNIFNLKYLIDNLDKDWHRKPDALYIIKLNNISEDDFGTIFKILWEYHIIHTLVIINDMKNDINDASVYSYYPYAEGGCGRDHENIMKICECKNSKIIDVVKISHDLDKPVLKNCTIQVGTHTSVPLVINDTAATSKFTIGIERLLLELLLQTEHVSWNYSFAPPGFGYGHILDNFTVTGKLGELYENKVDLVFGGFILSNRRSIFFDFICTHLAFQDSFVAIVRNAGKEEKWKMLFIMFDLTVWLLILFVLLFCAVLLADFSKSATSQKKLSYASELHDLFGSLTQNKNLQLRSNIFRNLIIVHWLWFTFLVNCFYQSRLTSFATYRSYKPQINEFSFLRDHNFTPILTKDVMLYFKLSDKISVLNKDISEIVNCGRVQDCFMDIAKSNTKYTVMPHFLTLWWRSIYPKEKRSVHIMKENFFNTLYGIFFKKGFPLLRKFDEKMLRIVEAGFLQCFEQFHRIHLSTNTHEGVKRAFEKSFLKLEDLIVPFYILFLGAFLSLLIFIVEITRQHNAT